MSSDNTSETGGARDAAGSASAPASPSGPGATGGVTRDATRGAAGDGVGSASGGTARGGAAPGASGGAASDASPDGAAPGAGTSGAGTSGAPSPGAATSGAGAPGAATSGADASGTAARGPAEPAARSGRTSPPTARAVRILDVLAAAAPEPLGVSEIGRRVGLAPSTCLGIVNELTWAGYLVRDGSGPRYGLGPALALIGRAAERSRPTFRAARAGIEQLAGELGLLCSAASVVGGDITVLGLAGTAAGTPPLVEVGARYPFAAPVGVMFAAWDTDPAVDAWLARAPVSLDPDRVDRIRDVVRTCRAQGWLAERLTDVERDLHRFLPELGTHGEGERGRRALAEAAAVFSHRDYLLGDLDDAPDAAHPVSTVCVPTFDVDNRPDLILSAYVMRPDVTTAEIRRIAERLGACAAAVTALVGGRDPWRDGAAGGAD
ncbi:helix-turn-helix domain-containing protein [Yinghuangia sp. YIM S09857]|uniref:IclR family transcriptional regulator n=1 Tax=Yinghuangia sp. YIM S09857 TaxID=3436929 RepID=UPI003F53C2D2